MMRRSSSSVGDLTSKHAKSARLLGAPSSPVSQQSPGLTARSRSPSPAQSSRSPQSWLLRLPSDVLQHCILSYLDDSTLVVVQFVCRALRLLGAPLQMSRLFGMPPSLESAAAAGYLNVLRWASSVGVKLDAKHCEEAAAHGHLELLQWLRQAGAAWNENVVMAASLGGHLELLQWAISNGAPFVLSVCVRMAALGGHVKVMHLLRQRAPHPWGNDTAPCVAAAQNGHLAALQWLRQDGAPWNATVCAVAAMNGHSKLLRWAHNNSCPWDERVLQNAVERDHFRIVSWALARGAPTWDFGEQLCVIAARRGNLEMLQLLHLTGGFALSQEVTYASAHLGDLELLQWAVSKGAPLHPDLPSAVAAEQHLDMLSWLHGRMPFPRNWAARAAVRGHCSVFEWMLSRRMELPRDLCLLAAEHNHLPLLQWARAAGAAWDHRVCEAAGKNCFAGLELLLWAWKEGAPAPLQPPWALAWECAEHGDSCLLELMRERGLPEPAKRAAVSQTQGGVSTKLHHAS